MPQVRPKGARAVLELRPQGRAGLVASLWSPVPETGFLIHTQSFAF